MYMFIQDEQHVLFHSTYPHVVSFRRTLFSPTGSHDMSTFLSQNNNKLYSPLPYWMILFLQEILKLRKG